MINPVRYFAACIIVALTPAGYTAQDAIPIYQIAEAQGTFLQIPLTHDIYTYSRQQGLQDVEIWDAENNSLPYRLISLAPSVENRNPPEMTTPLVFFPVAEDASPDTLRKLHSTQVKVQGDKVKVVTSDRTLDKNTPEFYLIDVSRLDHDLAGIKIDWVTQDHNQYLELEIEATANLQHWLPLGKFTLVKISQQNQSLVRNRIKINIPKKDYEFLRLKILRGADNLHITEVTGVKKADLVPAIPPARENWSITGTLAKIQNTVYLPGAHEKNHVVQAWEYIRNESTPIQTIAIDFGTQTYGDSATVFSRTTENQPWQLQHQGIWFNAQIGSEWQKSDPVNIYPNRDKYWRIELNASPQKSLSPTLVVGWQPVQLQMIGNGKSPYRLVINRGKNPSLHRDQVFTNIIAQSSPQWVHANLIPLGVPIESVAVKATINWKQWLFWVVLILAVGVLLAFSVKLLKQVSDKNVT